MTDEELTAIEESVSGMLGHRCDDCDGASRIEDLIAEVRRMRAERDEARALVRAMRGAQPIDVVLERVERAVAEWDAEEGKGTDVKP